MCPGCTGGTSLLKNSCKRNQIRNARPGNSSLVRHTLTHRPRNDSHAEGENEDLDFFLIATLISWGAIGSAHGEVLLP